MPKALWVPVCRPELRERRTRSRLAALRELPMLRSYEWTNWLALSPNIRGKEHRMRTRHRNGYWCGCALRPPSRMPMLQNLASLFAEFALLARTAKIDALRRIWRGNQARWYRHANLVPRSQASAPAHEDPLMYVAPLVRCQLPPHFRTERLHTGHCLQREHESLAVGYGQSPSVQGCRSREL